MITLSDTGAYLIGGNEIIYDTPDGRARYEAELGHKPDQKAASQQTMAYRILQKHNHSDSAEKLSIRFDKLTDRDDLDVLSLRSRKCLTGQQSKHNCHQTRQTDKPFPHSDFLHFCLFSLQIIFLNITRRRCQQKRELSKAHRCPAFFIIS